MDGQAGEELFEKFAHLAMHPLAREIFLPGESEDHAGAGVRSAGGEHTCCFVEPDRPLAARNAKQGLAMHAAFIGNPVAGFAAASIAWARTRARLSLAGLAAAVGWYMVVS
jgi:hypothetical protein